MDKSCKRSVKTSHKKLNLIESSSESETDERCNEHTPVRARASRRLSEKRNKPSFRLPSRDTVWNEIPDLEKPLTSLKQLTPRKTVNDFTKVYNTYNYDDYEDTGDESAGVDDNTCSSDSEHPTKGKHRIKNYHSRVTCGSEDSSSNSEDASPSKCSKQTPESVCDRGREGEQKMTASSQSDDNSVDLNFLHYASDNDADSDEIKSCRKKERSKFHNTSTSLLASDSSEDECPEQCDNKDNCVQNSAESSGSSDPISSIQKEEGKDKESSISKDDGSGPTSTSQLCDERLSEINSQDKAKKHKSTCKRENVLDKNGSDTSTENTTSHDDTDSGSTEESENSECSWDNEGSECEHEEKGTRSDLLKRRKEKEKSTKFKELVLARKRRKEHALSVASVTQNTTT